MSYNVTILSDDDIIDNECYCRPLCLMFSESDNVFLTSYGRPMNNLRWIKVKHGIGRAWWGKTVKEYNEGTQYKYEFLRGTLPKYHLYRDNE